MSEQASIELLRWTAEGARGVADGNEDVLRDAANIDLAADELEAHRTLLSKLRAEVEKARAEAAAQGFISPSADRLSALLDSEGGE